MKMILTCVTGLSLIVAAGAGASGWTQFRGEGARGVAGGQSIPSSWSSTEQVAWKTEVPGKGWSSPVVWDNQIFLTAVINEGETEAPKKGLYFGGERPEPASTPHHWMVYSLDLETGAIRWEREVHVGKPEAPVHVKNSYASETPVTDGTHVYAYFGGVGLFCLDLAGNVVWEHREEPRPMRYAWGTAASPVLHGERLYVVNDNEAQSYLQALDKHTGKEIWRVQRDEGSNWSTPFVWENSQRQELITLGSGAVRSYDLEGKLLWQLTGMSSITIATPYAEGDLLYFSSGYVGDRKHRPVYAVRPGASGDVSLKEGETSNAFIAWCQPMAAPYNPSTVLYDGLLYVLHDRGQFSCYDAKDGSVIYEKERLPRGAGFTASPWVNDGKIYCLNEDGITFVVKAGRDFEVLGTNPLGEADMGMATPAVANDTLILRTSSAVYGIRN